MIKVMVVYATKENFKTYRASSTGQPIRTVTSSVCHHYHFNHFAKGRPRVILYGRSPENHDFFDQNGNSGILT